MSEVLLTNQGTFERFSVENNENGYFLEGPSSSPDMYNKYRTVDEDYLRLLPGYSEEFNWLNFVNDKFYLENSQVALIKGYVWGDAFSISERIGIPYRYFLFTSFNITVDQSELSFFDVYFTVAEEYIYKDFIEKNQLSYVEKPSNYHDYLHCLRIDKNTEEIILVKRYCKYEEVDIKSHGFVNTKNEILSIA